MERSIQDIQLIFKHTPRDYRSTYDDYSVLYGCPARGTVMGPIESMPDEVYELKLSQAKNAERRERRDAVLEPIYTKFGIAHIFNNTRQWRDTLPDVTKHVALTVDASKRADFIQAVTNADIEW